MKKTKEKFDFAIIPAMEIFLGFVIAIIVLVFVHELGHFLFAKWLGCRVDEFAVGFAPFVFAKTYGETTYKLGLLPIGGYVKIMGENGSEELEEDPSNPRAFFNRPRWAQALVLFGGILFNMIFAWLLYSAMLLGESDAAVIQYPNEQLSDVRAEVLLVLEDSPAQAAGIEEGDVIYAIDNLSREPSAESIREYIRDNPGEETVLGIRRGDETLEKTVTTFEYEGRQVVGFQVEDIGTLNSNLFEAVVRGFEKTTFITGIIVVALKDFFLGLFVADTETLKQVSGPLGIASFAGDAFEGGTELFLNFLAVLSINLAIFNLLPIPALDGGRLVFVAIESILRRPINPKWFMWVNIGGFVFLIGLMIVVTVWDVIKLF